MPISIYHMPNRVHWATRIWRNTAVWKGQLIRGNQYIANAPATHTAPYTAQTRHYKRVVFSRKLITRVYDEFDHRYFNEGDTSPLREVPFQEINASFITHDIGDGQTDYIADAIVIDCQFDTKKYYGYDHDNSFEDPTIRLFARAPSMADAEGIGLAPYINLTQLNLAARPGRNIFQSYRQTPIDPSSGQGNPGDESFTVSPDDYGPARESLALVVPFTKFRRARLEFETFQKVSRIRGLTFKIVELPRRTYG